MSDKSPPPPVNRAALVKHWQVVVGNIGTVYDGTDRPTAMSTYAAYRSASRSGHGRGAHENVTLLCDGEVFRETRGKQEKE